jgi:ribosome-associated heat shock protein Hsp15
MRLDQWLWAVRLYKTRTLAAEAVKGGHVKVNGDAVKPAREVKPGDLVVARCGQMTRTLKVLGSPDNRVGAKLVPQFAEDLTPPEEFNRARDPVFVNPAFRPRGAGRPTKRERRRLDDLAL